MEKKYIIFKIYNLKFRNRLRVCVLVNATKKKIPKMN